MTALSCAKLLARRGWNVTLSFPRSAPRPMLLVNAEAATILRDIWLDDEMFADGHRLGGRRVRWVPGGGSVDIRQPSLVMSSDLLTKRMVANLSRNHKGVTMLAASPQPGSRSSLPRFDWMVEAKGRDQAFERRLGSQVRRPFGTRCLLATEIELKPTTDATLCYMETVKAGWLFLIPTSRDNAVIQGMVPARPVDVGQRLDRMIDKSVFIRDAVGRRCGALAAFPAYPQLAHPLCAPGWIAIGEAAAAFDPIAGDGVGQALRGAILGTAVLDGGENVLAEVALEHYARRVTDVLLKHIKSCILYYSHAFHSRAWRRELAQMKSALSGAEQAEPYRLRLNGFELALAEN